MRPKKIRSTAKPQANTRGEAAIVAGGAPVGVSVIAGASSGAVSGCPDRARGSRSSDAERGVGTGRAALNEPEQGARRHRQRPRGAGDQQVGVQAPAVHGGTEGAPERAVGSDGQL